MNIADAERMEGVLGTLGYERIGEMQDADLILLNTCCVRETAEDKVYGKIGEIKHIKQKNPQLIFGITGCMAQKEGEALIKRAPHIDFVLGTGRVAELGNVVKQLEDEQVHHFVDTTMDDAVEAASRMPVEREGTLSAWVPIMYGCNNFCTYCIVPYVRGRERSRRPEEILAEVRDAAAKGFKEVTLLGQNVNSYGNDREDGMSFAELLTEVDKVEGIERVRYMTSHPKDLSDAVIEAVKNGKHICEHFHLPVQYGTDHLLHRMNRKYTVAQYKALVERIREAVPNASITTDLIVGFPGETDEDFQGMLDFLREVRYDAAYTFIFSRRSGTPAADMPDQIPDELKKERLHKLMDVQNEISLSINEKLVGSEAEVLVEGPSRTDESVWTGHTRTSKIVLWPYTGKEQPGELRRVSITQAQTWLLKGTLAE
ncbi:MAG: tRNA (N6-isopentenyl adenosine(37)-C2)-methylthiotransferase MiaB [Schwartzia sp.]|nr:tRNA (N6-isopentenyl adenosine(37)-C2)-methylthiotransferase MiaB [Schwartzia sp. (in: firmicutes)]